MPGTVRRSLVSDQVFRLLVEDVLCDRYAPGEKLPTQRTLAAEYGVNMASIREAVKRLEQLGLVEVRHGDAMRVRDWRADGGLDVVAHVLFRAGGLDLTTLDALLEARRLMLREAARLAAERRTPDQARRLCDLAAAIGDAASAAEAQAVDFAFFSELVGAADNVVFLLILNSIRRLYFDNAEAFEALVSSGDKRQYERAARAVEAGSGPRAASAVEGLAAAQEQRLRGAMT